MAVIDNPISKEREVDFYAWALLQAHGVRHGRTDIDRTGIACELEAVAQREHRTARQLLQRVLTKMALCEFGANNLHRGRWLAEAATAVCELSEHLTPTLEVILAAEMEALWPRAGEEAADEFATTGGSPDVIPPDCPYTWEELFGKNCPIPAC